MASLTSVQTSYGATNSGDLISGSVRSHVQTILTADTGSDVFVQRRADYSVVQCNGPSVHFWNGYVWGASNHASLAELAPGGTMTLRYALLTGASGSGANQSTATVNKGTFYGMLQDARFVAAGGTVSADGLTVTVPNGLRFWTDPIPVRLNPLEKYLHQMEIVYQDTFSRVTGDNNNATLGDFRWTQTTNAASPVYATDWSIAYGGTTPSQPGGSVFSPLAVLGQGDGHTKLVAVDGDSIAHGDADLTTGVYGERGAIKRALLAAGYSWVSPAAEGSNVSDMHLYGGFKVRMDLLRHAYAVITDHGHNDRNLTGAFASTYLPHVQWHNGMLRAYAKPGARIVRTTLMPHTTSNDSYATLAGQTGYSTAADNPSTGWVPVYHDYLRRTGAYAGVAFGTQDPDAMWDFADAIGVDRATLKWPVNGTPQYGTVDGTHPTSALHTLGAADLQPRLAGLLGF